MGLLAPLKPITHARGSGKLYLSAYSLLLLLSHLSLSNSYNECMVTAPAGQFRGVTRRSVLSTNEEFCSYLGIQYGRLIRNERFQRPVLAEPLTSVYDATSDGNVCPQINQTNGSLDGNENCLYLNVFTPKDRKHNLPVMVFIHGGAFAYGSGSSQIYSPDYLIPHNIVFVAINYRLNVFGFLDLGIPECGGNMGLRDQVVALQWVRKNIRSFGGDPNSVTVMGQSAGAISIYLLQLSPAARGLFHRLIIQSAITTRFLTDNVQSYSIQFSQFLGYRGDVRNRYKILRFFQQINSKQLLDGFRTFTQLLRTEVELYATFSFFRPSVDTHLGNLALFPNSIEALGAESPNIPIIIGQTNLDGSYYFYQQNVGEFITYVQNNLNVFLDPVYTRDKRVEREVIKRVEDYYFNPRNKENVLTETILLLTDTLYYRFYERNAVFRASYHNDKIYNYQFCYDGIFQNFKVSDLGAYAREVRGAVHSAELNYLFYSQQLNSPNLTLTNDDRKIIYEMSTWWTNFAKTGNPNSDCDQIYGEWKPITPQLDDYLRIDNNSYFIETRINEERREFWDSLPRT